MPSDRRVVHVAPLVRLPRGIGVFDYVLPPNLDVERGGIVRVPFRTRRTIGVVLGTSNETKISGRLLSVDAIIAQRPLLPDPQLQLAEFVAEEGFSSIATTLRSILPTIPGRALLNLQPYEQRALDPAVFKSHLKELGERRTLVIPYFSQIAKRRLYRSLFTTVREAGGSAVLITPTIRRARELAADFRSVTVFTHAGDGRADRELFIRLRSSPSSLVIGTRSAIFVPLQNLSLIVIDDEDADEHLQEEPSPRYDSRQVADRLSQLTGARLILTSRLPSLGTLIQHPLVAPLDQPSTIAIRFIDLDEARSRGDYKLLVDASRQIIGDTVRGGGTVTALHHRRSTFASIICEDCGYVPLCETCRVPMSLEGTLLVCRHCDQSVEVPMQCPRCRGVSFRGQGRGLVHLLKEIEEIRNERADTITERSYGKISANTWAELDHLQPMSYDLAVVTRFDSLLSVPRVDAAERAQRLLRTLASKVKSPSGMLIVQGARSFEKTIRTLFQDPNQDAELELRERFGYPPVWRLVLLRRRGQPRSASISASDLVLKLKAADPTLLVAGPFPSAGRSRRDPRGTMLLLRSKKKLSPSVRSLLQRLDEGWTITIDPREIR